MEETSLTEKVESIISKANFTGLRSSRRGYGYKNGKKEAPDIGCPLAFEASDGGSHLGLIGYYVGGADEIIDNIDKYSDFLGHALQIYDAVGVINTKHVRRKLKKCGDKSPFNKFRINMELEGLGLEKI